MGHTCYICKWKSTSEPKRSYHPFPQNVDEKEKWLKAIDSSADVGKWSSVCDVHFDETCFFYARAGKKVLLEGSVPSLLLEAPPVVAEAPPAVKVRGSKKRGAKGTSAVKKSRKPKKESKRVRTDREQREFLKKKIIRKDKLIQLTKAKLAETSLELKDQNGKMSLLKRHLWKLKRDKLVMRERIFEYQKMVTTLRINYINAI